MLVVTRRANEKISFPTLGITVHILKVADHRTSVGIEAPPEVRIHRSEICPKTVDRAHSPSKIKANHTLANALNKAVLAIHLARKQCQTDQSSEANATLETALQALGQVQESDAGTPKYRMLIVEDDANERELLVGLLGMNGCECATASDGEDALTYLETGNRPDVVLLDMAMPRCDGPTTLRRIRADYRFTGLKVFSVSSTSPTDLNVPEGSGGFDGWFPKPLNPSHLWDAIQASLHSPVFAN